MTPDKLPVVVGFFVVVVEENVFGRLLVCMCSYGVRLCLHRGSFGGFSGLYCCGSRDSLLVRAPDS